MVLDIGGVGGGRDIVPLPIRAWVKHTDNDVCCHSKQRTPVMLRLSTARKDELHMSSVPNPSQTDRSGSRTASRALEGTAPLSFKGRMVADVAVPLSLFRYILTAHAFLVKHHLV